jgi:hypothetical protein
MIPCPVLVHRHRHGQCHRRTHRRDTFTGDGVVTPARLLGATGRKGRGSVLGLGAMERSAWVLAQTAPSRRTWVPGRVECELLHGTSCSWGLGGVMLVGSKMRWSGVGRGRGWIKEGSVVRMGGVQISRRGCYAPVSPPFPTHTHCAQLPRNHRDAASGHDVLLTFVLNALRRFNTCTGQQLASTL